MYITSSTTIITLRARGSATEGGKALRCTSIGSNTSPRTDQAQLLNAIHNHTPRRRTHAASGRNAKVSKSSSKGSPRTHEEKRQALGHQAGPYTPKEQRHRCLTSHMCPQPAQLTLRRQAAQGRAEADGTSRDDQRAIRQQC